MSNEMRKVAASVLSLCVRQDRPVYASIIYYGVKIVVKHGTDLQAEVAAWDPYQF